MSLMKTLILAALVLLLSNLGPQPGPETETGPIEMPRVKVGPAPPDASTLDVEIARFSSLDIASLQARSHNVLRRETLFRIIHIDPLSL